MVKFTCETFNHRLFGCDNDLSIEETAVQEVRRSEDIQPLSSAGKVMAGILYRIHEYRIDQYEGDYLFGSKN